LQVGRTLGVRPGGAVLLGRRASRSAGWCGCSGPAGLGPSGSYSSSCRWTGNPVLQDQGSRRYGRVPVRRSGAAGRVRGSRPAHPAVHEPRPRARPV